MYAIKLTDAKTLETTIHANIYQGEKGADTLVFVVPITYDSVELANCSMLMRYILPDGTGRSEELIMYPIPRNKAYNQYQLGLNSRFTDIPGDIELWLTAVDFNDNVVLKTGSTFVEIIPTKNIVDCMPEESKDQIEDLVARVASLEETQPDGLDYDSETRELRMTADGVGVGNVVVVPSDEYTGGGSDEGETPDWEPMEPEDSNEDPSMPDWEEM